MCVFYLTYIFNNIYKTLNKLQLYQLIIIYFFLFLSIFFIFMHIIILFELLFIVIYGLGIYITAIDKCLFYDKIMGWYTK